MLFNLFISSALAERSFPPGADQTLAGAALPSFLRVSRDMGGGTVGLTGATSLGGAPPGAILLNASLKAKLGARFGAEFPLSPSLGLGLFSSLGLKFLSNFFSGFLLKIFFWGAN